VFFLGPGLCCLKIRFTVISSFSIKASSIKLGTATVYFVFLGLPTGNAVNLLPIMPSIVLMKASLPNAR
jgi:hypothetical protein